MAVSTQMKYILFIIALTLIPGIVCAQDPDLSLRGRFLASSSGDLVLPGYQTVVYEGYLRLANSGGTPPLTNVTMTLLADNITKIDDPAYAEWTRSSAHWIYPPEFTIISSPPKKNDWTTDTSPTINVPVTFSRTLNQTTFSQDGYQLVQCNVTFWDTTNVTITWGEVDNYKKDTVNVTVLNDTFTTNLPGTRTMFQNDKQYQFSTQNMSEIIIGHPYTFSIVLHIERIDPKKTVTFKPLCGINLITTLASKDVAGANQTVTIPESELPPFVHKASASVNESVIWSYWSHFERSALLLENSSSVMMSSKIGIYRDGSWYIDMNGDGVWNAGDQNYGFGAPGWTPVTGDWNNNGKTEIGVYRDGAWYLDYDNNGSWSAGDRNYAYGAPGWTPVVRDWNGDGSDKIGVYKDGAWYLDYDGSGTWNAGDKNFAFGGPGWAPVVGKWTTDGESKIGVYKDGIYYIDYSGDYAYGSGDKTIIYGTTGSTALIGDWNNNGLTEIGTKTGSVWTLDYDGLGVVNASTKSFTFGAAGWDPVIGDWNADGSDKIGIYLNGAWYLDVNGNGIWDAGTDRNYAFGTTGWMPVVGTWS